MGLLSKFDWLAALSASAACSGLKISENSLFPETGFAQLHPPPPSLPKPRYLRPASTKAVFAAIFRVWWSPISALCAEISTSGPFGTPVSGGKNPVPNSARLESEGGKLFFAVISRVRWNREQTAHGSSGPPGLVTRASSRVELPQGRERSLPYIDSESIRIGCNKPIARVRTARSPSEA